VIISEEQLETYDTNKEMPMNGLVLEKKQRFLNMKISELLENDFKKGDLLKWFGIEISGNEEKTLANLCFERQLNEDEVVKTISGVDEIREYSSGNSYHLWAPALLTGYLEVEHHNYCRSLTEKAEEYISRVCKVHGIQHPEIKHVHWHFKKLKDKLDIHFRFEEQKFFQLVQVIFESKGDSKFGLVESVKHQAYCVETDHEVILQKIEKIRNLTGSYNPPEDACTTFRLLYKAFKELEKNLRYHQYIEEEFLVRVIRKKLK